MLVHTGQHYDDALSQVFFDELGLPRPEHRLELGGGSNTAQTARMLAALEPLLASERARRSCSSTATPTRRWPARWRRAQAGIPVAHVEAGMRSYDRTMPEELNRVLTDHASDLLLCSVGGARRRSCAASGCAGEIEVVGDVMVDVARLLGPRAAARTEVLERFGVAPGAYLLATAHRAGNVDDPARLERARRRCSRRCRARSCCRCTRAPRARLDAAGPARAARGRAGVVLAPPLGYLDFTALLHHARAVLTDSGGVQKEAYLAGVPCVTLRATTEWTRDGRRRLERARRPRRRAPPLRRAGAPRRPPERPPLYGDGRAGERVVAALARRMGA